MCVARGRKGFCSDRRATSVCHDLGHCGCTRFTASMRGAAAAQWEDWSPCSGLAGLHALESSPWKACPVCPVLSGGGPLCRAVGGPGKPGGRGGRAAGGNQGGQAGCAGDAAVAAAGGRCARTGSQTRCSFSKPVALCVDFLPPVQGCWWPGPPTWTLNGQCLAPAEQSTARCRTAGKAAPPACRVPGLCAGPLRKHAAGEPVHLEAAHSAMNARTWPDLSGSSIVRRLKGTRRSIISH